MSPSSSAVLSSAFLFFAVAVAASNEFVEVGLGSLPRVCVRLGLDFALVPPAGHHALPSPLVWSGPPSGDPAIGKLELSPGCGGERSPVMALTQITSPIVSFSSAHELSYIDFSHREAWMSLRNEDCGLPMAVEVA